MIALILAEIARVTSGVLHGGQPETIVQGAVSNDSRRIGPGDIFFALPGEQTDGHLFAEQAADAGAALVIVERMLPLDVPQVLVDDGVQALARLARHVVRTVRAGGALTVIGITGSNGKTTTKNLVAAILSREAETVAPEASYNNHVGAPLSMLRITPSTRYLIVEMGADKAGDIERLTRIAEPDIGIVLKVGMAHVGGFGSIEGTQNAKAELVRALPVTGRAVLNHDDPRVAAMRAQAVSEVSWFGTEPLHEEGGFWATGILATTAGTTFTLHASGEESMPVHTRILGEHHVGNILAAVAAAVPLGVSLSDAIAAVEELPRAERWRMELLAAPNGITVINDAYNASPDSTAAALRTLAQITGVPQRSVAVLGEMFELGEASGEEHDRLGELVVRLNIGKLVVVGSGARRIHLAAIAQGSWDGESVFAADADQAYDFLQGELRTGDVVLVKSSYGARLRFLGDRLAAVGTP